MGAHAKLSPSAAYRWMACPGSVAAESGLPDEPSIHALEGTKAHNFAEWCLRNEVDPRDQETFQEEPGLYTVVDEEMREAVGRYWDHCQLKVVTGAGVQMIETRVSLAPLGSVGEHIWGTADHIADGSDDWSIDVSDLKYGKGVRVEAEGNPQLKIYGLGAALERGLLHVGASKTVLSKGQVRLHIVQPRVRDDVLTVTYTAAELLDWWIDELRPAAMAALTISAERIPGEHCRFCKAAPTCPALQGKSIALAQRQFDVTELAPKELGFLLEQADVAEMAIKALRDHAHRELEKGHPVEGWKLVPRRATRRWRDETELKEWAEMMGVDEHLYDLSLRSPARLEKALGKLPEGMVELVSSGTKLAKDSHPAPAITAGTFEALEDEE